MVGPPLVKSWITRTIRVCPAGTPPAGMAKVSVVPVVPAMRPYGTAVGEVSLSALPSAERHADAICARVRA
jgi:hypothetical protein